MIAPTTEPVLSSNSAAPLTQFSPDVDQEALFEKVVVIVGTCYRPTHAALSSALINW